MHQRYEPARFIIAGERTKILEKRSWTVFPTSLSLSTLQTYKSQNPIKAIVQKYLHPASEEETKLVNILQF